MAFHFRENCANWLTNAAFDPVTLTAEYKACAVRIDKIDPQQASSDRNIYSQVSQNQIQGARC